MMNFIRRIFLFVLVNVLVVTTISLVLNILGVSGYLTQHGIDYRALAIFSLVWGMTASFISLLMSRWTAKYFTNAKLVDPATSVHSERLLIRKVQQLARHIGLQTMPEVAIYKSTDVNAFATGPTRDKALVAVSSGLLARMSEDELEGVLAHEMSHINNGDMVTMTLLLGIVNAFTLFLSRAIAYTLSERLSRDDRRSHTRSYAVQAAIRVLCDLVLTLLGSVVVAAFSRYREYRADRGGAKLVGRQKMIAALERLRTLTTASAEKDEPDTTAVAALKINKRPIRHRLFTLFATHPDIDLRIAALQK